MVQSSKAIHERELAKKLWPLLEKQATIYDAQTVLNAAAGFIKLEMLKKEDALKVADCNFDISKEKDSEIKTAIVATAELLKGEKAKDMVSFLDSFGKTLAMYGANEYLKNKMKVIKVTDIVK